MYITYLRLEVMSISPFGHSEELYFQKILNLYLKILVIIIFTKIIYPLFFTLFASFLPFDFFHPTTHIKLLNLIAFYIGLIFLYFIASKYFQDKYFLAIFFYIFYQTKLLFINIYLIIIHIL